MIHIGMASTQGTRARQEDAFSFHEDRAAVFDGMGGHGAGDKAALAAAAAFANPEWKTLSDAIRMAHWAIVDVQLRGTGWEKSAGSIAAVQFTKQDSWSSRSGLGKQKTEHHLTIAWSGDSRVYIVQPRKPQGSRLELLSRDHHNGDGLTARLGSQHSWQAERRTVPLQPEDLVLLTTDGLHELPINLEDLVQELLGRPEQEIAQTIIDRITSQAQDNATLVVMRGPQP